jgi:hypothetical protein
MSRERDGITDKYNYVHILSPNPIMFFRKSCRFCPYLDMIFRGLFIVSNPKNYLEIMTGIWNNVWGATNTSIY